jgi:hypothetical protein
MKLSAPKQNVWILAVIIAVLGLIGYFIPLPILSTYAFWFVTVGFVLLLLGTLLKGF